MRALIRYRYMDNLKTMGIMLLVLILIPVVTSLALILSSDSGTSGYFGVFCMAGGIFSFVIGIVTILTDLRLGLQLGVGRRSVAVTQVLGAFLTSATLAACSSALLMIGQVLIQGNNRFVVTDLYQMIYTGGDSLSLGGQVINFLFNGTVFWLMSSFGTLLGLAFYRLNKLGRWILGVFMVAFFNLGLPSFIERSWPWVREFFGWLMTAPGNVMSCFLICTALFTAGGWLLLRRAPVRPAGRS